MSKFSVIAAEIRELNGGNRRKSTAKIVPPDYVEV
jgi:hypothetical protein